MAEPTIFTEEHFGGFGVSFELPFKPWERDFGEFASMGLMVGAAMADVVIGHHDWNMVHPLEIVHRIPVGDVGGAPDDVENGTMEGIEGVFGE